ncbi:MAG: GntR family transcriptional regulator [Kiritimatiellae bacterium]|nr:GntR family transcriptional regulator [Kiritimatiellia bacterium]
MKEKASDRVEQWVATFLADAAPGARLPGDRDLAARLGLSERTVRSVLSELHRRGLVRRLQGSGTYVPGEPEEAASERGPVSSGEAVADWVHRAMAAGELKRGEALPPIKRVAARFHVARRTVIAAYRRLVGEGYVQKIGKSFWVGDFKSLLAPGGNREVFVFNCESEDFSAIFSHPVLGRAYERMVDELFECGYSVLYENVAALPSLAGRWLRRRAVPHALFFCGLHEAEPVEPLCAQIRRLRRASPQSPPAPRALLALTSRLSPGLPRDVLLLMWGNVLTQIAHEAARYCVAGGFKTAHLYFHERRQGPTGDSTIMKTWAEIRQADPALTVRVVVQPAARRESRPSFLARTESLLAYAADYSHKFGRRIPVPTVARDIVVTHDPAGVFAQVAQHPSLHVFPFAAEAAEALARAQAQGLAVPQSVSIVTLQDDPAYLTKGLAHCGIDCNSAGYVMAHALIGDIPVARTRRGFLKLKSRLIERQTARPPAQH